MHFTFEDTDGYFTAIVSGAYSLSGMLRLIDAIAEFSAKWKMKRVLVDVSNMKGDAPTHQRFEYASHAATVLAGYKCAACAGTGQRLEPFTEEVAQNRGLNLRVFLAREDAVRWLLADADAGGVGTAR